ncbi:MAG: DMT family transporter [Spirochaetaceae bacterium]|nr:DMT family transporter [Spirochaetaceae bacterium]
MHSKLDKIPSPVLAVFACLLWATAFAGVKTGLLYANPLFFAGLRFFIAGLILLPFCGSLFSIVSEVRKYWRVILIVSLFQTVLLYSFFFLSLSLVEASTGAIVQGISPLIGALMAHFMLKGNRLTIRKLISFFIALSGIVLITIGKGDLFSVSGREDLLGILFMLLGSISGSFASIYIARKRSPISPVLLNSVQISLGGLVLFLLSLVTEGFNAEIFTEPEPRFFIALIYLSSLSAVAFSIWFYLLKDRAVPVTTLSIWKFIIPVGGAVFSWILLADESPDLISLGGMVATGLAVLLFFSKAPDSKIH